MERFEIYIAGMEIGNAYTELNDPQEQRRRFEMQLAMRERGDEEAHQMDEDYLRAMATACRRRAAKASGSTGSTMMLTDSRSIRDVILFPLLRPEGEIGMAESCADWMKTVIAVFRVVCRGPLPARAPQGEGDLGDHGDLD